MINNLIALKSASSMKSRNWMRVADAADDVLSTGAVTAMDVAVALSTDDVDGALFGLVCFFLFPGLIVC